MDVMKALVNAGAVDDGSNGNHYVYSSKKHGPAYINMDMLFPKVQVMEQVCTALAGEFNDEFDTVVGAATGGIPLAALTGYLADAQYALWADKKASTNKEEKNFAFERAGFGNVLQGRNVLIVEDLLTTGGTVMKVVEQVRKWHGNVIGVSCVCNRGGATKESLGVPRLEALCSVDFKAYLPEHCLQCIEGVPIVADVGHGNDFQAENPDYHGGFKTLLS